LVIETSLYYDAQSEKHQITVIEVRYPFGTCSSISPHLEENNGLMLMIFWGAVGLSKDCTTTSSVSATTLDGFWPALRFRSTIKNCTTRTSILTGKHMGGRLSRMLGQ